jgi:L-serine dehydratase
MMDHFPSIFNDVIGPVMRGPSSSHCAAAVRIGRMARDLMDGEIQEVSICFDTGGSLAATYESQGSHVGLMGGLLGWGADDERLVRSAQSAREKGIEADIRIADFGDPHPNTYRLSLRNDTQAHEMIVLSTGGGMIEVIEIDGVSVSMTGDYVETLVYLTSDEEKIIDFLRLNVPAEEIAVRAGKHIRFIEIKSRAPLDGRLLSAVCTRTGVAGIKTLAPVLPVLSSRNVDVPFVTCRQMLDYNRGKELSLCELAVRYECARGNISGAEVMEKMKEIVRIMRRSLARGLSGTEYSDRILGCQSKAFRQHMEKGTLLGGGLLNRMILYVTALMEAKSAMEVIVAAPTAGSCGVLPGACLAAADEMGFSEEQTAQGLLSAGLIGIFISVQATFAAELGGCQAECGAGSGMAAAALVTLTGGSTCKSVNAASTALQNILGMVCDPVANRVEVPCLGKNVLAAANALSCANMAIAGFDPVIPLDEVIEAMYQVGRRIPSDLRCTGRGGLSVTRTAKEIEKSLAAEQIKTAGPGRGNKKRDLA